MDLNRLICIDLDQPTLEGFRKFISSWIYRGDDFTLLVDPGPHSSIPRLLNELRRHGIERIDYILLTHLHIDHAGGAGALLHEFPEAKVICHPEGIRHMSAPEKLWLGSLQVLGKVAETYGEIVPIPARRAGFEEEIGTTGVRAFLTPGHAPHHVCYLVEDLLFGGEVAGVRSFVPQGIYMRPATPPRFLPGVALDSIDSMKALNPRYLIFAHYGLVDSALKHLQIARGQILLWVRGAAKTYGIEDEQEREKAFFEWLLDHDDHFRNIARLPPDIHARERLFFGNTFKGMYEYVESMGARERQALAADIMPGPPSRPPWRRG